MSNSFSWLIFFRAEALQSILQLMGEKEMFEYWSQTYRVHNLEWSQEKAADILHAWQRKFTQVNSFVIRSLSDWITCRCSLVGVALFLLYPTVIHSASNAVATTMTMKNDRTRN